MELKIEISQMCSMLDEHYYENIELDSDSSISPSYERIRQLAFSKLRMQSGEKINSEVFAQKEKNMKISIKVLLIAAVICVLTLTAFAAFGGLEFFKFIFGDSARNVANEIQAPMLSAENVDYKMTVESLLTDGYKTNLIISLNDLNGKGFDVEDDRIFIPRITGNTAMSSSSCKELPEFSQNGKRYFNLECSSLQNYSSSNIEIALNEELASLHVSVALKGSLAHKEILINADDYTDKNYFPELIQLSPMGVLVIGSEKQAKGGLPTAQIFLQMNDGSIEELISKSSFDDGEETVVGGGGAIIVDEWQTAPLVTQTMGERNPDGKVVTTGSFSRILNLNDARAILVDDIEYPIQ